MSSSTANCHIPLGERTLAHASDEEAAASPNFCAAFAPSALLAWDLAVRSPGASPLPGTGLLPLPARPAWLTGRCDTGVLLSMDPQQQVMTAQSKQAGGPTSSLHLLRDRELPHLQPRALQGHHAGVWAGSLVVCAARGVWKPPPLADATEHMRRREYQRS